MRTGQILRHLGEEQRKWHHKGQKFQSEANK